MARRQEKCNHCGIVLGVPPEVHVFECAVCHGITHIRPTGPLSQAYNSIYHIADRFRGFINTIMTSSVNTSSNPGYYGATHFGYHPQPQSLRPSYPLMPPPAYGSKRAVLCGICYHGKSYRLKGTVNDVKCMKYFLIKQFGFPSDSILMLTDDREERNPLRIPTKHNIQMALRWLIEGSRSGDSLVFHFSGHGTREMKVDEVDGFDEAICPVDYEHQGKILGDEINAEIVRPLPHGAKLHAIIDACHSGTVLDLQFVCNMNREGYYRWEDHKLPRAYNNVTRGLAICISACDVDQISVDTSALSGKAVTGALTYSFIQSVQNEPEVSYGRLLSVMRSTIRGTKTGIVVLNGPVVSLLNRLLGLDIKQEPQLSSSEIFDIYRKRFVL
ncbi:metacaspase-3 [Abrus precatorius]|uniref:Metacaspase-3 n=1 Tax=Abrus precatorius TaxID=3816 RepID=A0A8B8KX04_ABRPR|nr:metacaspase-3 [Abrus precatorius]